MKLLQKMKILQKIQNFLKQLNLTICLVHLENQKLKQLRKKLKSQWTNLVYQILHQQSLIQEVHLKKLIFQTLVLTVMRKKQPFIRMYRQQRKILLLIMTFQFPMKTKLKKCRYLAQFQKNQNRLLLYQKTVLL